MIFLLIVIIVFCIVFSFSYIYNRFQDYIIKINEVESKIDENLRNKYDNILKINDIIKNTIKTDKVIVDDIYNIKSDEKSSFEIDRILIEDYNKVIFIKKQYKELDSNEDLSKIFFEINGIDESLNAYRKYYNENISKYNELIRKMPYKLFSKIFKYNEKTFFDGKDLNDDNIKDFKL